MELFLSKLLPLFVYPLGLAIALVLIGGLALWRGRRWGLAPLLLAVAGLWAASAPYVAAHLRAGLEERYLPVAVDELPAAQAIVVLGGSVATSDPPRLEVELSDPVDRVRYAARLLRAGKAPLVIVSGGAIPWLGGSATPEAEIMRPLLEEWGVPREAVVLEARSRNTRENAVYTRELLARRGLEKVLLVTSALHMPRAVATFRALGLEVIPAPTDYGISYDRGPTTVLAFLPDAGALEGSTRVLKEYLGLLYYRWRGWAAGE